VRWYIARALLFSAIKIRMLIGSELVLLLCTWFLGALADQAAV
jgi:hypothetical protein